MLSCLRFKKSDRLSVNFTGRDFFLNRTFCIKENHKVIHIKHCQCIQNFDYMSRYYSANHIACLRFCILNKYLFPKSIYLVWFLVCLKPVFKLPSAYLILSLKSATGSCSVKKVFWGVFLPRNWSVVDNTTSAEKKSYSVETGGILEKLGVPLCLFSWVIDVFSIIIERKNSEHSCQI